MRHEAESKSNAYWLGLLAHLQAAYVPRKVNSENNKKLCLAFFFFLKSCSLLRLANSGFDKLLNYVYFHLCHNSLPFGEGGGLFVLS